MKIEYTLAILLAQLNIDDFTYLRVRRILKQKIDWYIFCSFCLRNDIVCLVIKNIINLKIDSFMPENIYLNMYSQYKSNIIRNKIFLDEVKKISSNSIKQNINITSAKGIYLLDNIYKSDIGVRILRDIDFIVSNEYQQQVHEMILTMDYNPFLINNNDFMVHSDAKIFSYLYIKEFQKLDYKFSIKIDFDYNIISEYDMFTDADNDNILINHFLYLCLSFYKKVKCKKTLTTLNISKIVDIYELYKKNKELFTYTNLKRFAKKHDLDRELDLVFSWLNTLYINKQCEGE